MNYVLALFLPPLSILLAGRPIVAIVTFLIWIPAVILSGGLTHPMFILLAWILIYQSRRGAPDAAAATRPRRLTLRTRFAPSPTGRLHLGHAFSALTAWELAQAAGGTFLLRIEDIDAARCRPEFEAAIYDDLAWLGLAWPEPVLRQSEHLGRYAAALDRLAALGLTYPCRCTRADIRAALVGAAGGRGRRRRSIPAPAAAAPMADAGRGDAVRLDLAPRARPRRRRRPARLRRRPGPLHAGAHRARPRRAAGRGSATWCSARKDIGAAYHLAVVVDDAARASPTSCAARTCCEATPLHRLLQALLGLPVPVWHHHRLIRDEAGRRLAKRDDARALAALRGRAGRRRAELRGWRSGPELTAVRATGSARTTSSPSRTAVKKQLGRLVWQAGPVWSTISSRQSRSQSTRSSTSRWTWPEVAPLRQSSPRERDQ